MMDNRPLVLIVDDVELNRSFLKDMLMEEYQILEASNGMEALVELKKYGSDIAIVLLDVVMPEMDGFEVLTYMNQMSWINDIPVVMISAENSVDFINKGFKLGAVDYISRPFDANIIRRRVENTIVLYSKQKSLQRIVKEQIREKEKNNSLMVDILSTIVEFRNGESGIHVLRIRVITEILLEALSKKYPKYQITPSMIAVISNAAALHDVGKIMIPEEILNKPGRLTDEEFNQMKTHTVLGAEMLDNIRFGKQEELIQYAHAICRWHHERWDGRGYPDGLAGEEIPISAQVVSLADVYDALVSVRVYKPAYSHKKTIQMILSGECGAFNPDLMECLISEEPYLEERIRVACGNQDKLFDVEKLTQDVIVQKSSSLSDRTLFLLEQERTKYQFLASLSNEILFDYDVKTDMITLSERGKMELGVDINVVGVAKNPGSVGILRKDDWLDLIHKVKETTPDQPFLQVHYLVKLPDGEEQWYEFTMRSMWSSDLYPEIIGCIGKMTNIHEQKIENFRLKSLAERDSLTKLYNNATARRIIEEFLSKNPSKNAAILFFDVDDFKMANDTYGHIFGDNILKYIAEIILQNIRSEDVAARIGGDEFLIFLKCIRNPYSIEEHARRICKALSNHYKGYYFSVSMGVASYPVDGKTYSELLNNADKALYASKRQGKNQVSFYSAENNSMEFQSLISEMETS